MCGCRSVAGSGCVWRDDVVRRGGRRQVCRHDGFTWGGRELSVGRCCCMHHVERGWECTLAPQIGWWIAAHALGRKLDRSFTWAGSAGVRPGSHRHDTMIIMLFKRCSEAAI
jgi:hypothetical protein